MFNKTLFIAALMAIVLCLFTAQADAFKVSLYEHKHFKGKSINVEVKGCTDIPDELDELISSIDPAECVLIFKHADCKGPRVRVDPYDFGTAHLEEINFEDKLSSLAPCSQASKIVKDEH